MCLGDLEGTCTKTKTTDGKSTQRVFLRSHSYPVTTTVDDVLLYLHLHMHMYTYMYVQ